MTDQIEDAVSGEELSLFTAQLSDGRTLVLTARDSDQARALAREQGGNVGVLSIEEGAAEPDESADDPYADPDARLEATREQYGDDVQFTSAQTPGEPNE